MSGSLTNAVEYPVVGSKGSKYDGESDTFIQTHSAKPATKEEIEKELSGYTHPDLHRRIDPQIPDINETGEIAPRDYQLGILGVNSYRTTTKYFHDDVCEGDIVHYREIEQEDGTKIRVPVEIP